MQYRVSKSFLAVVEQAKAAATKYSNPEIGTEHMLYGLLSVDGTYAYELLTADGLTKETVEAVLENGEHVAYVGKREFTDRVNLTIYNADRVRAGLRGEEITPEHFLYQLLQDYSGIAYAIVKAVVPNVKSLCDRLEEYFTTGTGNVGQSEAPTLPAQLNDMGQDITQKARDHKIDPIVGRKEEIERIIQILCRKTKNNPVLIGEPGVGKSAVVEGLAKEIVEGNVPEFLKNKIVFSLNMGGLVAGTKYRGALEEKLKDAIEIIRKSGNIIVFIDELHTLAQAGSKEGEVSPADILKPYLARGELQTIGATTTDEYKKFIEKDKALERRFQPIIVAPPSVEETIEILTGLKESYEAFHKVKLSDEAIKAAAELSDRYIMDRFLPDKAIDLIDEAMSKAKVRTNTVPPEMRDLEDKLKAAERAMNEASDQKKYEKAAEYRNERDEIKKQLEDVKIGWSKANEHETQVISGENIAEIVSKWTKIPVTKLSETETQKLVKLEDELHKRVIGQDKAIISVAKAIRRARAGLKDPGRPIGTFLFLGPTGVGKTELTKALSEVMFDGENAIIRMDMSEYMEPHSVSKLIGSPPGYVGFDDGGQLTEQVRRKPYSVILFDEVEKAHPDVLNILLQMMDDGRLTDAQGRTVSFKNSIIIMTSNVGVEDLKTKTRGLGFAESESFEVAEEKRTEEVLSAALKRRFKPEFLNRIDVICYFHHLSNMDIAKIADLMLDKVRKSLAEKNITLKLTRGAMDYIISAGYDRDYGARPLRRIIEQTLEDNIAEKLLDGSVTAGSLVTVDVDKDGNVSIKSTKK